MKLRVSASYNLRARYNLALDGVCSLILFLISLWKIEKYMDLTSLRDFVFRVAPDTDFAGYPAKYQYKIFLSKNVSLFS